jgi:hypothetical protein
MFLMKIAVEAIASVFTTFVKYRFPDITNFVLGCFTGALGIGMVMSGDV